MATELRQISTQQTVHETALILIYLVYGFIIPMTESFTEKTEYV